MSKRLILILALAFVIGLSLSAYAEVQNVKVSGDLLMSGMARGQFDLDRGADDSKVDDDESMFLSQIRLRVDADLTDNVSTTLRLINERNWEVESATNTDIDLDLAYATLKEFLYSPLTLTVGRQELRYGNALIIGASNTYAGVANINNGVPSDLTMRKAFEAIKASFNYDPLIIDVLYAKIDENSPATKMHDDVDLYGVYASYDLGKKNAKADLYFFNRNDTNNGAAIAERNKIKTIGTVLSAIPLENLFTSLEVAHQFGSVVYAAGTPEEKEKDAWAVEAIANYAMPKVKYTPSIGATYVYLTGDGGNDEVDRSWNAMYYDQKVNNIAAYILPFTDASVYAVNGSMKPMEDLKLSFVYGFYRLNRVLAAAALASNKYDSNCAQHVYVMNTNAKTLGSALDLTALYDYTEDVQLGLTWGYFLPGKAFADNYRTQANQVIGSMKVTF